MDKEIVKKLTALGETEFKRLYQGSFVGVDKASESEDSRTILVVARNYNQFRFWKKRENIKDAIYISRPFDFNGRLIPEMFRLILLDGYYENRRVVESYEFEEAINRLDASKWLYEVD